jgi:hypothetical protein
MQVEGVEGESWPSAPFGALRFWDNGTAWSQIEVKKGEFKWDNLENAVTNAEAKGMTDILQVLGTTPPSVRASLWWLLRWRPPRKRAASMFRMHSCAPSTQR